MCGIMGYLGFRNAGKIVLKGLKKLEYRGYDSWGICLKNKKLEVVKRVGLVSKFSESLPSCNIAIGHTRWSTHGKVCEKNAHPHLSCDRKIAVVHNGIIENFDSLKKELSCHKFASETDTEVLAHLIEEKTKTKDIRSAFSESIKKIKGSYAVLAAVEGCNKIFAAKHKSPLVIGIGNKECFIASDVLAFADYIKKAIFLGDREEAEIQLEKNRIKITITKNGKRINKKTEKIHCNHSFNKKGFDHFMLKEIFEQPESIKRTSMQNEKELLKLADMLKNSSRIFLTGCGTAFHACLAGSSFLSKISGIMAIPVVASEFNSLSGIIDCKTTLIAVSQSGETADVIEAIETAKAKNAKVASIVNVPTSTIARKSDIFFNIKAGPEIAVASTKAFTSQISFLFILAYSCIGKPSKGINIVRKTAKKIEKCINSIAAHSKTAVEKINASKALGNSLFVIGKGLNFPIALESALKIKEVSYIHAEGFAGGELKHGTLALIENKTPCIVHADSKNSEIISNAMEIKSRGGTIIGISDKKHDLFDILIKIPRTELYPVIHTIPCQFMAYYLGLERGCDIDHCRNLAKSVTVK